MIKIAKQLVCDFCHNNIDESPEVVGWKLIDKFNDRDDCCGETAGRDLCDKCAKEMQRYICFLGIEYHVRLEKTEEFRLSTLPATFPQDAVIFVFPTGGKHWLLIGEAAKEYRDWGELE